MAQTKTTATKVSATKNAQKILDELQAKHAAVAAAGAADEAAMANVAYEAHLGDQKAVAKLETLRERAIRRAHELSSLDAAVAEATARVQQARAAESLTAERKHAEEAREIADRVDMLFTSADKHLSLALDALKAADGRIEELHRLGFTFPTANQVRLNAAFAIQTYLMQLPKYWWTELNHSGVRFLAPHERRTFSQLWSRMVEPIARNIGARLGEEKEVA